jgi:hypothetical protein
VEMQAVGEDLRALAALAFASGFPSGKQWRVMEQDTAGSMFQRTGLVRIGLGRLGPPLKLYTRRSGGPLARRQRGVRRQPKAQLGRSTCVLMYLPATFLIAYR